ncbi:MAG: hypothetical protein KatS3mg002_1051 [Candidatus Woesearchaeota archaeon]|jgi:hypothetical protein|nr:MAG: hypothetical protein KatS3mg002_1051 [Candidatus Woesearchaeota archaeon]
MTTYNTFKEFSNIPYSVVSYLLDNSEDVWRLLKYDTPDAWDKNKYPNLSKIEKGKMIYDGVMKQEDARVFMTTGMSDGWVEMTTQLRISIVEMIPSNTVYGNISIGVEILPHFQVNQLSNYRQRDNMIAEEIIRVLNGAEITEGLGRIYFDFSKNPRCKMTVIGSNPFIGKGLIFCNWISG